MWSHTNLTQTWKLYIFDSCIVSKLLYGLVIASLNKSEYRRLDGFQARCLRRILKNPSAYYSRISNARVRKMAGKDILSQYLMNEQMILMGKLAFRDNEDVVRRSIFLPNSCELRPLPGPAKRGRPRARWAPQVLKMCIHAAGSYDALLKLWHSEHSSFASWKWFIRRSLLV